MWYLLARRPVSNSINKNHEFTACYAIDFTYKLSQIKFISQMRLGRLERNIKIKGGNNSSLGRESLSDCDAPSIVDHIPQFDPL